MKRVTIKDIAAIAGVSRGTVDRVINKRGNVDPLVEKSILKIAKDLGYQKNMIASNLAINKIYSLAIVLPSPHSDLFWHFPHEGLMYGLKVYGHYNIQFEFFDFPLHDADVYKLQLSNALRKKPDAIITSPIYTTQALEMMDLGQELNIPFITINTELQHDNILCYIGQDSFHSGYLAGRLLELRLSKSDEVVVINFGHNISNALHYSDKVEGLKQFFMDKYQISKQIAWYEFYQYDNPQLLNAFFDTIVQNHPHLKALFFTNSRAYKLFEAISDVHKYGLYIVGFDMVSPNIRYLKEGKLDFIINQNPVEQGYFAVMNFVNHFVLNLPIKRNQYLPLDIILKENVDYYLEHEALFKYNQN